MATADAESWVGGMIADTYDRKRSLMVLCVQQALFSLVLALVHVVDPRHGHASEADPADFETPGTQPTRRYVHVRTLCARRPPREMWLGTLTP